MATFSNRNTGFVKDTSGFGSLDITPKTVNTTDVCTDTLTVKEEAFINALSADCIATSDLVLNGRFSTTDTSVIDLNGQIEINNTVFINTMDQLINELLEAGITGGTTINVAPGIYIVNEPVKIPANTNIRGSGSNTTIFRARTGFIGEMETVCGNNVGLADFTLDLAGSGGTGIGVNGFTNTDIQNVKVKNGEKGANLINTKETRFDNYDFENLVTAICVFGCQDIQFSNGFISASFRGFDIHDTNNLISSTFTLESTANTPFSHGLHVEGATTKVTFSAFSVLGFLHCVHLSGDNFNTLVDTNVVNGNVTGTVGFTDICVYTSNVQNVKVDSCDLRNANRGVRDNTNGLDIFISNCYFSDMTTGVLSTSNTRSNMERNLSISNSTFLNTVFQGVVVTNKLNFTLDDCFLETSGDLTVTNCENVSVSRNKFSSNVVVFACDETRISESEFTLNFGIEFTEGSNIIEITKTRTSFIEFQGVNQYTNVLIAECYIERQNEVNVSLSRMNRVSILNNRFVFGGHPTIDQLSALTVVIDIQNLLIQGNSFDQCRNAIALNNSPSAIIISNNFFTDIERYGIIRIGFAGAQNITITSNTVVNSSDIETANMRLEFVRNLLVDGNNLQDSGGNGIELLTSTGFSDTVVLNNVVRNSVKQSFVPISYSAANSNTVILQKNSFEEICNVKTGFLPGTLTPNGIILGSFFNEVLGAGTSFSTDLQQGDIIQYGNDPLPGLVVSVNSDDNMTTLTEPSAAGNGYEKLMTGINGYADNVFLVSDGSGPHIAYLPIISPKSAGHILTIHHDQIVGGVNEHVTVHFVTKYYDDVELSTYEPSHKCLYERITFRGGGQKISLIWTGSYWDYLCKELGPNFTNPRYILFPEYVPQTRMFGNPSGIVTSVLGGIVYLTGSNLLDETEKLRLFNEIGPGFADVFVIDGNAYTLRDLYSQRTMSLFPAYVGALGVGMTRTGNRDLTAQQHRINLDTGTLGNVGASYTVVLPDLNDQFIGHHLRLHMTVYGQNLVVQVNSAGVNLTTFAGYAGLLTFNNVGDSIVLEWTGMGWNVKDNIGVVVV